MSETYCMGILAKLRFMPLMPEHILFIVGCDSRKGAIIYSKRKIVRGSTFVTRRAGK
jgi:hypothetical protein